MYVKPDEERPRQRVPEVLAVYLIAAYEYIEGHPLCSAGLNTRPHQAPGERSDSPSVGGQISVGAVY